MKEAKKGGGALEGWMEEGRDKGREGRRARKWYHANMPPFAYKL
jgi:hypothetical protein